VLDADEVFHGTEDVSFADGHAFPVTWQFATNVANSRPDF